MKNGRTSRFLRDAVLVVAVLACIAAADWWLGDLPAKTQGWLLAAATSIFFISEAFFWRAMDKMSELPLSDSLTGSEAEAIASQVKSIKGNLVQRWFVLFALKIVAGACAAWLLAQTSEIEMRRVFGVIGCGALSLSFPVVMTFFHTWRRADLFKTDQLTATRLKHDREKAAAALRTPPVDPFRADDQTVHYTDVVNLPKARPQSGK
jgi:hypothetical protein